VERNPEMNATGLRRTCTVEGEAGCNDSTGPVDPSLR